VQVIVEEAGGTFTDFAGEHRIDGQAARSRRTAPPRALLDAPVATEPRT
jgi:hypothetical protein